MGGGIDAAGEARGHDEARRAQAAARSAAKRRPASEASRAPTTARVGRRQQREIADRRQDRRRIGQGGEGCGIGRIADHQEMPAGPRSACSSRAISASETVEPRAGGAGRAEMLQRLVEGDRADARAARQPQPRAAFGGISSEGQRAIEHGPMIRGNNLICKTTLNRISAAWD